jgi:hypothetical protein
VLVAADFDCTVIETEYLLVFVEGHLYFFFNNILVYFKKTCFYNLEHVLFICVFQDCIVLCELRILFSNCILTAAVTGTPVLAHHIRNDWSGVALCAGQCLVYGTEIRQTS